MLKPCCQLSWAFSSSSWILMITTPGWFLSPNLVGGTVSDTKFYVCIKTIKEFLEIVKYKPNRYWGKLAVNYDIKGWNEYNVKALAFWHYRTKHRLHRCHFHNMYCAALAPFSQVPCNNNMQFKLILIVWFTVIDLYATSQHQSILY